ncbi:MAG: gamma-glutamyltransferase [Alphaproteobacteria bacterium]|nr:gamma-glutamyltransferase [Alphaproteobacteria bacterium]
MRRALALSVLLAGPALAQGPAESPRQMVAAAHPLAVEAGLAALRAGGSAVDAAVAVQVALGLAEPQSSGIGGGAFIVYHDRASGRTLAYDGRETAPAAVTPRLFLDAEGRPISFRAAVASGKSVGVPGALRVLALAHKEHGKLPWRDLIRPTAAKAREGFAMGPRLHRLLGEFAPLVGRPAFKGLYQASGRPLPVGTLLTNADYAATLEAVAGDVEAFYRGPLAEAIVAAVQADGGAMTASDLAGYRALPREPVCGPYRAYRICSMPPPSSGGIAVLQMLAMLERFDLPALSADAPAVRHVFAEAGRLAFADRDKFVADADFVPVPVAGLLDRAYLRTRAGLIDPLKALGTAAPGEPAGRRADLFAPYRQDERAGTSHVSIVDASGNALSMTTTIEGPFGAGIVVGGFLLNNQLTDFSFRPEIDGAAVANRVEAGKRPRSSMAPSIVFDARGEVAAIAGSAGGARIIGFVAQTLSAMLDHGMDPLAAMARPHVQNRNGPTEVERGTAAERLAADLRALGHAVTALPIDSGQTAIRRRGGVWQGAADPRREGSAGGN